MARESKKPLDFETSLKKLEEIVQRLENEQVPLEESLRLFEEGKKLARACETELQQAENRIRQLMAGERGEVVEVPLAPGTDRGPGPEAVVVDEAEEESRPGPGDGGDLPF